MSSVANGRKIAKARPHGKIEKIFENIWFIQGQVKMPMAFPPMVITKSMTIVRNPQNNELTLINAMALNDEQLNYLSSLGEIKNTLRVGGFHGKDDEFYKIKFGAKVYALKGHSYSKKFDKTPIEAKDGYLQADVWLDEKSPLPIPKAKLLFFRSSNPIEAVLHIEQDGGIIITGDSLQNMETPDSFFNLPAKFMMKKMGFFKPYNIGPGWLQFAKPELTEVREVLLNAEFENVLPGHGSPVIGGAKEKYRPILEKNN